MFARNYRITIEAKRDRRCNTTGENVGAWIEPSIKGDKHVQMISDLGHLDFLTGGNKNHETYRLAMDSFFEYEMSDPQVTLWGQEAFKTASPVQVRIYRLLTHLALR